MFTFEDDSKCKVQTVIKMKRQLFLKKYFQFIDISTIFEFTGLAFNNVLG